MDGIWPRLDEIGLSAEALATRRASIGGSDANVILSGDPGAVLHLWRVKRGDVSSRRLDDVLPAALGQWTEDFSRQWFERQTGLTVENAGLVRQHPEHAWMTCTLDGLVRLANGGQAVFEAKHCAARAVPQELIARYMPQLTHNMLVTGTDEAILSVLYGNAKWEAYTIDLDLFYAAELIEAERGFWDCVQTGRRPSMPRITPPPCRLRLSLWSGLDAIRPALG